MKFNDRVSLSDKTTAINKNDLFRVKIPELDTNQVFFRDTDFAESTTYVTDTTIKYTLIGANFFEFNRCTRQITTKGLLVINEGNKVANYTTCKTKAISVFLATALLKDVYRNLTESTEDLLNLPFDEGKFDFFDFELKEGTKLKESLEDLYYKIVDSSFELFIENDMYYKIAEYMLMDQDTTHERLNYLSHLRTISRKELYRRLNIAKAYLDSTVDKQFHLEEVSRISALSKYHLVRMFSLVYGLPPHKYFIRQKNIWTRRLLETTDFSLQEIIKNMGYTDAFSFCKQFKKMTGFTPSGYRKINCEGKKKGLLKYT